MSTVELYEGDWASTTLGDHIADQIDDRIAGITSGDLATVKPIFSTIDHTTPSYVRNTSCWAYDVDLTPISVWNTTGTGSRNGALISPRHMVFATHYRPNVGADVRFVAADNTVVTRTISAITDLTALNMDISIGLLDSDVPASISFARIISKATFNTYVSDANMAALTLPVFYSDNEKKALVGSAVRIQYTNWSGSIFQEVWNPSDTTYCPVVIDQRALLYETKVGGDSGCPAGFIINDKLILLLLWYYPNYAASYGGYVSNINTVMTALGGGYQLTEVDLSSFPEVCDYNAKLVSATIRGATL